MIRLKIFGALFGHLPSFICQKSISTPEVNCCNILFAPNLNCCTDLFCNFVFLFLTYEQQNARMRRK